MDLVTLIILVLICLLLWHNYCNSTVSKGECEVCGHHGHKPSVCYHRNRTCGVCLQRGHISSVCSTIVVNEENSQIAPSYWLFFVITWTLYILDGDKQPEYRCRACGKPDHKSRSCRYLVRRCHRCRVKGHISAACPGYRWYLRNKEGFKTGVLLVVVAFIVWVSI